MYKNFLALVLLITSLSSVSVQASDVPIYCTGTPPQDNNNRNVASTNTTTNSGDSVSLSNTNPAGHNQIKHRETPDNTSAYYVTLSELPNTNISKTQVKFVAGNGTIYTGPLDSALASQSSDSYRAVNNKSKPDKSQGLLTDRAFGSMTAGFVLAGALKVSKMAPLFVDYGIAPLAVKAGLVKSTAHFALSKLATVGSTVCFGYCIPAILLPFLLKCCYDARSMTNSSDSELKDKSFKTCFKSAALKNLGFVWNGMQPALWTVTSIAAFGGLLYLDMLAKQNK